MSRAMLVASLYPWIWLSTAGNNCHLASMPMNAIVNDIKTHASFGPLAPRLSVPHGEQH